MIFFIYFLVFSMMYYQVKVYLSGPLCNILFLKHDYKHEHDYYQYLLFYFNSGFKVQHSALYSL